MYIFFSIISLFALISSTRAQSIGYTQDNGQTRLEGTSFGVLGINKTFDYVIIGGGNAGLTLATRLAENSQLSIAVVEGGGFYEQDNGNVSQVPAFAVQYSSGNPSTIQPAVDWGMVTSPQSQLNGRQIHYTQAKCLGGGTGRNYLIYQRGTKGTYQQWANMVGDSSFTFDNLLKYFKKSVQFTPPDYAKRGPGSNISYDPAAFGSGGPLQVSYFNYYMPFSSYIKKALQALGMSEIAGANSGQLLGFTEITASLDPKAEIRSSSESSFMQQAIAKTSIQIYQRTLANKIVFSGKQATGVEVTTAGSTYTLSASKEIIVSAGVFRSPQLLMVSGVGPSSLLQSLNIPVVADLAGVGQNIIDHPFYDTTFKVNIGTQSRLTSNATFLQSATQEYLNNQSGPLTASAGNYIGWEKLPQQYRNQLSNSTLTELMAFPSDWPELQYVPVPAGIAPVNDTSANYMSMSVVLTAPTSRGNLTLNSTSTAENPIVNIGWLSSTTDQQMAVAGLKRARQLANATGLVVDPEIAPGNQVQSDADILEFIKGEVRPIHHGVSSCTMGKSGDKNAVVDTQGRVFGVQNLRVVDTSIFPLLPPGQIQATVYALAEKIADQILNLNGTQY